MKFIELKVHASRQGIEALTEIFLKYGIDRLSIDDPADFDDIMNSENQYDWDYVDERLKDNSGQEPTVSVYLNDNEGGRALLQRLKLDIMMLKGKEQYGEYGENIDFGRLYAEDCIVDDEDWKDKWKENFKPSKITDSIVVKPSWEEYSAAEGEKILEIDPGMAFGTGTHETTSLCMKLMEKYVGESEKNPEEISVIDVGCGSGILSIAAALMGCGRVLGIEIDEKALSVAEENVELNKVADRVSLKEGNLMDGLDEKGDIIVANLMHNLIMEMAPAARKHLEKGGIFISSGILLEKKDMVAAAVEKAGFEILEIREDGEWCAIAAKSRRKGLYEKIFCRA